MPEWVITLLGGGGVGVLALAMKKVIVALVEARKVRIGSGVDISRIEIERLNDREERIFVEANRRIEELKGVIDRLDETIQQRDATIEKLREVAEERRTIAHDLERDRRDLQSRVKELEFQLTEARSED